jgi:5-methylcytosine-specific restriction endonuclease McrA
VNLLRAHGGPSRYWRNKGCRCVPCRSSLADYMRVYYATHPESRERQRRWKDSHRDRMYAYTEVYRKRHPEEVRACYRRWYARNRELNLAYQARKRTAQYGGGNNFTRDDVRGQRERQGGTCFWCKGKLGAYHIDHVIPIALGGSNGPENIVISCPHCNLSKSAQHPMDFAGMLC